MKKVIVLSLVLFLAACGKKGPLIYPEAQVPVAITDLKVEQQGERFLISWSQPGREEGGERLRNLAGFRLFRREVLPPAEDCEECPTAYRLIRAVDVEYLRDAVRLGSGYLTADADLAEGKTYQYKIVSFKRDGTESGPSNKARKKMAAPPAAPKLKALLGHEQSLVRQEGERRERAQKVGAQLRQHRADGAPEAEAPREREQRVECVGDRLEDQAGVADERGAFSLPPLSPGKQFLVAEKRFPSGSVRRLMGVATIYVSETPIEVRIRMRDATDIDSFCSDCHPQMKNVTRKDQIYRDVHPSGMKPVKAKK